MEWVRGYYIVDGPSTIIVEDGTIDILGYRVVKGATLTVPYGRRIPVKIDGIVSVRPSYLNLKPANPQSYDIIDTIASKIIGFNRVVIVGPTDSGKSTLSLWALNKALSRGISKAYYLTVDIGQNEVYCPGFESLALINPPAIPGYTGSFRDIKLCFVGSFTPRESLDKYLECASELASKADGMLIVDTDGWIKDEGLRSKAILASTIKADIIIALGLSTEEVRLLKETSNIDTLSFPKLVKSEKSVEERKIHRERLIAQKLIGSKPRLVSIEKVILENIPLFKGKSLDRSIVKNLSPVLVYAEILKDNSIVAVYRGKKPNNIQGILLSEGWEKGLLAAVYGIGVHVGIVDKINYEKKMVIVITAYEGPIEKIEIGKARLTFSPL
ncbi:MAG: Clp1/GlmU family protein [Acidilobaceae archaeon]